MLTGFYQWLQIAISSATLLAMVLGALKVVHVAEKGVDGHEKRIVNLETQSAAQNMSSSKLGSMETKVDDMCKEIERMRNRLDQFLDSQARQR